MEKLLILLSIFFVSCNQKITKKAEQKKDQTTSFKPQQVKIQGKSSETRENISKTHFFIVEQDKYSSTLKVVDKINKKTIYQLSLPSIKAKWIDDQNIQITETHEVAEMEKSNIKKTIFNVFTKKFRNMNNMNKNKREL
jgi:uncharacterized membrane protein YhiD involved in acid resistance